MVVETAVCSEQTDIQRDLIEMMRSFVTSRSFSTPSTTTMPRPTKLGARWGE